MDDQKCIEYIWNRESKNYCQKKRYSTFKTYFLTLTLNKIYFDINEKDKQQEIDNIISRYQ